MFVEAQSVARKVLAIAAMITAASLAIAQSQLPQSQSAQPLLNAAVKSNYGKLPLRFEANQGQANKDVRFLSRGVGYGLYLTGTEAVLALDTAAPKSSSGGKSDILRMQLLNGTSQSDPMGIEPLPGASNYLLGNNPAHWHTDLPNFAKVRYNSVYRGVDLIYYGNQQQLEYDFVVSPGADTKPIQLHFAGAKHLSLDELGNLVIEGENGAIAFHKPVLYQSIGSKRKPVEGRFTLIANNSIGFAVGDYDHSKTLVIDPSLQYSTYLGGSNSDTVNSIAVDSSGNAYLTGYTLSTDYPVTPGVVQATDTDSHAIAFITKLNPSGTALIYSTFIGGSGSSSGGDNSLAIAIDSSGDAYITGSTYSKDFPKTSGVYQAVNKSAAVGAPTGFVTKINPAGTKLLYSTFLGGSSTDNPTSIAIDSSGDAYIAGVTLSTDFPLTAGVIQTTNKSAPTGDETAFVSKLNPTATALVYSTYLGGSSDYPGETPVRIAIDSSGDAFVSGSVDSTDFPVTAGAYQTTNKGIAQGGFNLTLSKLNPTATKLIYSTYIGGSGAGYRGDVANGLAIDSSGNAYLAGITYESNFPVTTGALDTTNNDAPNNLPNGFVTKMNPTGTALVYSTYLGGSGGGMGDVAYGIAVDSLGDAYVTGSTGSTDFPVTGNAYQSTNVSQSEGAVAFLSELNPAGASLIYSTYFGGANSYLDAGYAIALGSGGAVYFTGNTGANNFPITPGAYKQTFNSANFTTGFVAEFSLAAPPTTLATITTLTSNANPAVPALNVTFTASVVPSTGAGIPTGNVIFSIDQTNVATVALSKTGFATYSSSTLAYGAHAILASYVGDTKYGQSGGNITETIALKSPTFTPASGIYSSAQLVTLSDTTAGTAIYYTTDGTAPTTSSTKYTSAILVSANAYIQAIAGLSGAPDSSVSSANYGLITAPTALAVPASALSTTKATLNGLVNTYGMSGSYYFQYGTTSALTLSTPKIAVNMPAFGGSRLSIAPLAVSSALTTLTSKTKYYFQVVVVTPAGTSSGTVLSFTTD